MFFIRLRIIGESYFVLYVEISCIKNMLLFYSYIFCINIFLDVVYVFIYIYIDKNKVLL